MKFIRYIFFLFVFFLGVVFPFFFVDFNIDSLNFHIEMSQKRHKLGGVLRKIDGKENVSYFKGCNYYLSWDKCAPNIEVKSIYNDKVFGRIESSFTGFIVSNDFFLLISPDMHILEGRLFPSLELVYRRYFISPVISVRRLGDGLVGVLTLLGKFFVLDREGKVVYSADFSDDFSSLYDVFFDFSKRYGIVLGFFDDNNFGVEIFFKGNRKKVKLGFKGIEPIVSAFFGRYAAYLLVSNSLMVFSYNNGRLLSSMKVYFDDEYAFLGAKQSKYDVILYHTRLGNWYIMNVYLDKGMVLRFPLRISDNIIDMVASKRGIVLYRESGEIIFSIEGIK